MADYLEMKRIKAVLVKYGETIVELMRDELRRQGKDATGNLIKKIDSYVEEEDDKAFLYLDVPTYGRKYVDGDGYNWARRPNKTYPPKKEIRDWIRVKGIRPDGRSKGAKTEDQLVFLIRRAIGVRGIRATPFIHIFYDNYDKLEELIENAAAEDLEEKINEFVKEFNKNN